jgi:hypothetical protein
MLPLRAYTFIGLNAVRFLSIVTLLLVFASSIVTLVHDIEGVNRFVAAGKVQADNSTITDSDTLTDCDYIDSTTVPNQPAGAFWAVLNRLLIIGQVIILMLSEFGWPATFFDRFFPVLGKDFGLGALGVIQCLIGATVLSHHVDDFALVSAFFLFAIGCLNILIGLIFRASAKSKRSITSWREHGKSVLPNHTGSSIHTVHFGGDNADTGSRSSKSGYGFGRQGEKAAGLKGYLISKPVESLPRYAPSMKPAGSG